MIHGGMCMRSKLSLRRICRKAAKLPHAKFCRCSKCDQDKNKRKSFSKDEGLRSWYLISLQFWLLSLDVLRCKLGVRLAYYNPADEQWAKEMREFIKRENLRKK